MSSPFVPKGPSYHDGNDKLRLESRNGVIQAEFTIFTAKNWTAESRLTPEVVLKAQELAITQIYRCAGHFRDGPVELRGATHEPPSHTDVPRLVSGMCEYVNGNWTNRLFTSRRT